MSERVCAVCAADGATVCSCDKPMISPAIPSPKGEMPLADIDLDALITTWERNPSLLGFRDAVLSCLRELKVRRSASSRAEVRREALEEAAKVAEQLAGTLMHLQPTINPLVQIGSHLETCRVIATAIRSLSQGE